METAPLANSTITNTGSPSSHLAAQVARAASGQENARRLPRVRAPTRTP